MLRQSPLKEESGLRRSFIQSYKGQMSKMAAEEVTEQRTWMLAPEERRTAIELLNEVAELEQSVGFPLLNSWFKRDDSSERSASPVMDLGPLNAEGQPLDDSQHQVLRSWSPVSVDSKKQMVSIPSDVQAPPEA